MTMITIYEIKTEAFKEFLKRLGKHKLGKCMDIVPMDVDHEKIKIPKIILLKNEK
jgi:hypothetical protein